MPTSATISKTSIFPAYVPVPSCRRIVAAVLLALATAAGAGEREPALSPARTPGEAGLVDIRALVPDIAEDIHYAGSDNFTGATVDGYQAPRCYLLRPAALALQRVERTLRSQHMRLKVWDCYRPARAVRAFVRWAGDRGDLRTRSVHYPHVDKSALLGEYIAPISGHSRGATADLTLMQCTADDKDCRPLDMGTDFDYFDPLAHTDSPSATPAQRTNRQRLLKAMAAEGFVNYPQEWWHYTLPSALTANLIYDVPVK
jgi:D-alanyl-D-alanine dipeptidase